MAFNSLELSNQKGRKSGVFGRKLVGRYTPLYCYFDKGRRLALLCIINNVYIYNSSGILDHNIEESVSCLYNIIETVILFTSRSCKRYFHGCDVFCVFLAMKYFSESTYPWL